MAFLASLAARVLPRKEGRKRGNLQVTTRKIKKCHEHRKERAHWQKKMNGAVYCQTIAALTRVVY